LFLGVACFTFLNFIGKICGIVAKHKKYELCPLLADLFLYSYESEFLPKLVKDKKIHKARAFNFTYRYIDDVETYNDIKTVEQLLSLGFENIRKDSSHLALQVYLVWNHCKPIFMSSTKLDTDTYLHLA
jgi:hypothetical protein